MVGLVGSNRRARWAAVAAGVILAGGCVGADAPGESWVELGSGETRFEPLADGDEVEFVAGAQGGWHLWASVRAGGFGERARLHTLVEPAGWDGPRQEGSRPITLDRVAGEPVERYVGSPVVLSYAPCFEDRPLRLAIELTDERGHVAADERIVVPRAPEMPEMGECTWSP